jgi:cytochrome c2
MPRKGEQHFNTQCRPCHSLEAGKNGIGPTLHGLFGRKAGTVPGYSYSAAMKNSGVVWNEDTLTKYLADPKEVHQVHPRRQDDLSRHQGRRATRRPARLPEAGHAMTAANAP